MSDTVNKALRELELSRDSLRRQIGIVADICEKSNRVLAQIEGAQAEKPNLTRAAPNEKTYAYSSEVQQVLIETTAQLKELPTSTGDHHTRSNQEFMEYLDYQRERTQLLDSNMRKLAIIDNTVSQMEIELLHQAPGDSK